MGIENHVFTMFQLTFRLTFEQFFQSHTVSGIRSWESMKHLFISLIFRQACQTQFIFHRNSQTWAVAKLSESLKVSQWIKLLNPLISPHFFPLKSNIACASGFYYLTSTTHSTQVCWRKKPVWTFQHRASAGGVFWEHSFAASLTLQWERLFLHKKRKIFFFLNSVTTVVFSWLNCFLHWHHLLISFLLVIVKMHNSP